MLLQTLAHGGLPEAGQRAIIKSGDAEGMAVLAWSPTTSQKNIDRLVTDRRKFIREGAYRRTTDINVLGNVLSDYLAEYPERDPVTYACQNPLAPPDLLAQMLADEDNLLALHAYINPNTPEKARRKLQPEKALALTEIKHYWSCGNVLATELVLNNPWMAETPTQWGHWIRHAICESPYTAEETLRTLAAEMRCSPACQRILSRRNRPKQVGAELEPERIPRLLTATEVMGIHATGRTDLRAICETDFTETQALTILDQKNLPTANITGRLVNRFGSTILLKAQNTRELQQQGHNKDYLGTCGMFAPILVLWGAGDYATHQDIARACGILGDSDENWEAYITLTRDWYGTWTQAAETVCKL